jgi:hypothetical protein
LKHLQAVITANDISKLILNTPFTVEHFNHIKKLYNKYKELGSCSCVNIGVSAFEERKCPFVSGCDCGKTAELLTGRDGLRGRGCFAVIAATYEWAKDQKFAKIVKI